MTDTRKIIIHTHTGYSGMDYHEFYEINSDATEEAISQFCWELAKDNAESFGIYPEEEMPEDISDDDTAQYSYNIEGYYEDYNSEIHDGFITGSLDTPVFYSIKL